MSPGKGHLRFAVIGRTRILVDAAIACQEGGHVPVGVLTCSPSPEDGVVVRDFEDLAARLGVPFRSDDRIGSPECVQWLRAMGADLAISVNWRSVIPASVLAMYPRGVLNAHAGDLPRYRGNAPLAWAILQGEDQIGLTIHQMNEQLDAGPIVLKRRVPIGPRTRIGELWQRLGLEFPAMFREALDGLASGAIVPTPQPEDPRSALRVFPRRPEDGRIEWRRSAVEIDRLVRASSEPYPGAFASFEGRRMTIWEAVPEAWPCPFLAVPGQVMARDARDESILVATGDGVLRVLCVSLDGGPRVRPASVVRSLRQRLTSGATE